MFLIQALVVVVSMALIAHYVYFARYGETSFSSLWVLALLIFAYPLFQVWRMGGTRPNAPGDSVTAKFVSYLAIPVTVLIALVGTVLFVFGTASAAAFFYPLVIIGAAIVIVGTISAITGGHAVERITTNADHRNDARHVH
jgi:hypothetical protein